MDLVALLNSKDQTEFGPTRIAEHIKLPNTHYFLSIQASQTHYCSPRQTLPFESYGSFEIMMDIPNEDIPENWAEYDCGGVYGWVPKEEIETLLEKLNEKYGLV